MQSLPELGTSIAEVVGPTYQLYTPLLLKQAKVIKSTKRETFTYGSHARQQLDVYTPSNSERKQDKLLIFLYGGGLVRGDKIGPIVPEELVYANLGHFFAERLGCKVVIPDYRLISHEAKFPSGGEDLALVVQWAKENIKQDSKDPLDLYIMGNSAGGIHSATYLFASQFAESRRGILGPAATELRLKGVVLLGVPFHFGQAVAERADTLSSYYGNEVQQHCPLGLMRSSKEDGSIDEFKEVHFLVMTASLDPKNEILVPNDDFVKEWRERSAVGSNLIKVEIEGHNHISPVLSLGTGIEKEEEWGQQVVDFVTKRSTHHQ